MNKSEREKLRRVHEALRAIPGPSGGGTQSSSLKGMTSYASDMAHVRDRLLTAIYQIGCPNPDYTPKEQDEDFDDTMKPVEDFIKARQAQDWR